MNGDNLIPHENSSNYNENYCKFNLSREISAVSQWKRHKTKNISQCWWEWDKIMSGIKI